MNKKFILNGQEITVEDYKHAADVVSFSYEGMSYSYSMVSKDGFSMILESQGVRFNAAVGSPGRDGECMVMARGREGVISEAGKKMKKAGALAGGLTSPMPGKIFKVLKEKGSDVKKGDAILILEAMKMEHSIRADKDGVVKNIFYQVGQLVQGGVVLAEVEGK